MRRRSMLSLATACATGITTAAGFAPGPALAATPAVAMAGQIGRSKALLMIDGHPVTLAVGQTRMGVTLRALHDGTAEVERDGRVAVVHQGQAPVRLDGAGAAAGGGREIVLPMGPGGHFVGSGAINGRAVRFMVDTGATVVALSADEASRIGIDVGRAPLVSIGTANGEVQARRVTLTAVTLGAVTVANVAAVVLPAPMTHVLLGNSFLQRFQLQRENDVMRLQLR
ncbi:MAG: TIGR02281 family clan AA aspartic protease [Burkholderiales bacterium]|nr:TIGR02281 family clan AA aspartic protease [Burkholderiales bacterium]